MMDTKVSKVLRSKMADPDDWVDNFLTNIGRLIGLSVRFLNCKEHQTRYFPKYP